MEPTRRFDFKHVPTLIFQPKRALADISVERNPSWLTPMLILTLTAIVSVIVGGYLIARGASAGPVDLPPDFQSWSSDMQDNYFQSQQAAQSPVIVYVLPTVGALITLWLGWLILSGMLHLISTLLGGRGTMGSAFNLIAWASLPFALRDILRVIYMLIAGHAIVSPGFSGFAGDALFWSQILARTDIFFIWYVLLLIIGIGATDGLTKSKSVIGILIVILLSLLAQAGMGALAVSLGKMATGTF